ncbi:hypothetical protein [Undibacterium umbellatum]|uniref:Peptidase M61 catalytic domain-containing protein n=1 Tax=Undibacterium umbellatum TaxID=2762300 RepID=A0ABR6Z9K9_9BURK|nr:hypothetical protein [Undibacterium umbellatum]MBC3907862.1 hypothetical protein [Undibacterium umbellatum]
MKFLRLGLATFACLLFQQSQAADVTVHLKLISPEKLEVSYQLPQSCDVIPFLNHETLPKFGGEIRARWQAVDDCGTADGTTLTKTNKACSGLRFDVPAASKFYDRVSPGSFPMGEGMYVNTTSYAVSDKCGSVGYQFSAPGSIAFKGQLFQETASYDAYDGQYMAVLLLKKQISSKAGVISYFNPALGEKNIQLLQNIADQAVDFYYQALPDVGFRKPILAATVAQNDGGPSFWGDAGDVLRLALYNWPEHPNPDSDGRLRKFVWHEFAHRFQPPSAKEREQHAPYIVEGGAEYLRWTASLKTRWVSPEDAASELGTAISNCIFVAGEYSWKTLPQNLAASGSVPYDCGLALHVMGLAVRQNDGSPLQQMNDYYRAFETGNTNSFEQAIECGKKKECTPQWLPKLMGEQPMSTVWPEFLASTQLAKPAPLPTTQYAKIQRMAFATLMEEDCNRNISFYTEKDAFVVGEIKGCGLFKSGMSVHEMDGKKIFGSSLLVDDMVRACKASGKVSLGLKNGESIAVPCKGAFKLPQFYAVDMKRLMQKLDL